MGWLGRATIGVSASAFITVSLANFNVLAQDSKKIDGIVKKGETEGNSFKNQNVARTPGRIQMDTDFFISGYCIIATGGFKENADDVLNILTITGPLVTIGRETIRLFSLSKGDAYCSIAKFNKQTAELDPKGHKLLWVPVPSFSTRAYAGGKAVGTPRNSANCFPWPMCKPGKFSTGGASTDAFTTCFEIAAKDTSDKKPRSLVIGVGNLPANVGAELDIKKDVKCSEREGFK